LWRTPQVADIKSSKVQAGYTTNLTHQVLMYPTPKAQNANAPSIHGQGGMDLQTKVQMFPTPLVTDAVGGSTNRSPGSKNVRPSLARMATGNKWPTPIARDWRSGKSSQQTLDKNSRPLREIAAQGQESGQLNPEFVEWLMGLPLGWTDLEL
jgi:hypothetical protein